MSATTCPQCEKRVATRVERRREVLPVRGEDVEVEADVAVCLECGEDLFVEEMDDRTLRAAFAEYRRRHGLLSPEEIAGIRRRYDLGQRPLSLLLGWGEITLHRYEGGSLQDDAHDAQLRMAANPANMRVLLAKNSHKLSERQRTRLEARLDELEGSDASEWETCAPAPFVAREEASEYGGYQRFDPSKLHEMILCFAGHPDMFATKLNKLLFYADFLHFKEFATPISGVPYLRFQHGPVPEHYGWTVDGLVEGGELEQKERSGRDWGGVVFEARRPCDLTVFTPSEKSVLEFVAQTMAGRSSKSLRDRSHAEAAYLETPERERISYSWAKDLSVSLPRADK
jgi:putative zinc finger/helix-turn-helix YgiT family protein